MGNSKKHSINQKKDIVQEPATDYKTSFEEKLDPTNTDEQEILLRKLIEQSIQDSKEGKGISNEEMMMRRVKIRYPFLK